MKFVLASNNKKKLSEMSAILNAMGHEIVSMEQAGIVSEPEETGATFEENALIKARACMEICKLPSLADDSGLCVDALGGEPGIYSARYCEGSDRDRVDFLLKKMESIQQSQRTAQFVSAIACVFPNGQAITVRGECRGEITAKILGSGGFGYDPIFYVPLYKQTFAELTQEIKNSISHRARAMEALKIKLDEIKELTNVNK